MSNVSMNFVTEKLDEICGKNKWAISVNYPKIITEPELFYSKPFFCIYGIYDEVADVELMMSIYDLDSRFKIEEIYINDTKCYLVSNPDVLDCGIDHVGNAIFRWEIIKTAKYDVYRRYFLRGIGNLLVEHHPHLPGIKLSACEKPIKRELILSMLMLLGSFGQIINDFSDACVVTPYMIDEDKDVMVNTNEDNLYVNSWDLLFNISQDFSEWRNTTGKFMGEPPKDFYRLLWNDIIDANIYLKGYDLKELSNAEKRQYFMLLLEGCDNGANQDMINTVLEELEENADHN